MGVGGPLRDDLGIWNTGDDEYSGNGRICCKKVTEAGWVSVVTFKRVHSSVVAEQDAYETFHFSF